MIGLLWAGVVSAGSVQGTITDADGGPLESAVVVVYDQRFGYAYVETNDDGAYVIEGLPANPYRVRVLSAYEDNAVEAWLPGGLLDVCAAEVVDLGEDDLVMGLDIRMEEGGVITGTLVDSAGQPVAGIDVAARTTAAVQVADDRYATTDEDGHFTILGLPPDEGADGTFAIAVDGDGFPGQYLGPGYEPEDAASWTVEPSQQVDTGRHTLLDGIVVRGTVRGPDGPADGVAVYAYAASQVVSTVSEDGAYEALGLPPGDVIVWASGDGYATTYHPAGDRPSEAEVVPVPDEGGIVDGLDVDMPFESRMVGVIQGGDGDLTEVSVLAYNDTKTVGIGDAVDSDGSFVLGGLHEGQYTLYVWGSDVGLVDDYLLDDAGSEQVIEVPFEGDSATVVVELPLGASVSGTVVDKYSSTQVYGATVVVEGLATGTYEAVATDHDGAYALVGLPADHYTIHVYYDAYCPSDPDWVEVYYPDATWEGLSEVVLLGEGQVFEWHASVAPDGDHDGMDDVWEAVNGLDPTVDDGALDADGDGYTNLEEYLQGTDPRQLTGPPGGGCGCGVGGAGLGLVGLPVIVVVVFRRRGCYLVPRTPGAGT